MVLLMERLTSVLPAGRRARATDYVALHRSACDACWECLEACPNGVLGKVGLQRHAVIRARDACTGCLACVDACRTGALTELGGPAAGEAS